jgi:hypothetical protein
VNQFLKNKIPLIFSVLFLLSIIHIAGKFFAVRKPDAALNEFFKPELKRLNTIDKFTVYVDSVYASYGKERFDTALYVSTVSDVTKKRFYHGSLDYTFSENWIAALSGKLFWSHLSSIVIADDILKHSHGLCSQQTIIFMETLKRKNITMRSVGLGYKEGPGHFLCEVNFGGAWHLYDVSVEPNWTKVVNHHKSLEYYLKNKDSLYQAYSARLPKDLFNKVLEKHSYGKINQMPAHNMSLFHFITWGFTYLIPFFCLFVAVRLYKSRSRAIVYKPAAQEKQEEIPALVLKEL